jgi:hypothetical protein
MKWKPGLSHNFSSLRIYENNICMKYSSHARESNFNLLWKGGTYTSQDSIKADTHIIGLMIVTYRPLGQVGIVQCILSKDRHVHIQWTSICNGIFPPLPAVLQVSSRTDGITVTLQVMPSVGDERNWLVHLFVWCASFSLSGWCIWGI